MAPSATWAAGTTPTCPASTEEILCGYRLADGSSRFLPAKPVLRAQAAKLLCGAFDLTVEESLEAPFADLTPDGPDSLYPHDYIAAAAEAGIVKGFMQEGGPPTFEPWRELTRAQLVTIVVRAMENLRPGVLESPPEDFTGSFGDFDQGHAGNLRIAEYNGLLAGVVGFGPGWSPWAPCSRGEVAQVLYDLLKDEAFSQPAVPV